MTDEALQSKLLAFAVYEIRLLLAGHLGSGYEGNREVNIAAHLAYALHNEALAVLEGKSFDAAEALSKIQAVDRICETDVSGRIMEWVPNSET